jgi:glutathione S-transferase
MKLHFSPASPYVRKVMACAVVRGIDDRIEKISTNPHVSPLDLLAHNPLSKVPALVSDEGLALFDSPVICEFLDGIGDAPPLFPAERGARIAALRLQAVADGILDAAVGRRGMAQLPQDDGRMAFDARQKAAVDRALALLETEAASLAGSFTIGSLAVGCALGYLDFRFPHEPWRNAHPALAGWFLLVSEAPALARTIPAG